METLSLLNGIKNNLKNILKKLIIRRRYNSISVSCFGVELYFNLENYRAPVLGVNNSKLQTSSHSLFPKL